VRLGGARGIVDSQTRGKGNKHFWGGGETKKNKEGKTHAFGETNRIPGKGKIKTAHPISPSMAGNGEQRKGKLKKTTGHSYRNNRKRGFQIKPTGVQMKKRTKRH